MAPLSTSSSGSTPPNRRCCASVIVTPTSTRSRPARQVPVGSASSLNGARCAASRPQRIPLSATQSCRRARLSSSRRKRRRTGSRSARSSSCDAVTRCSARSIRAATTPSTGLVWRSDRSASRTRRSGGRTSAGSGSTSSSSVRSPAPNVAWMSGANVSMSGHITITSRGSRRRVLGERVQDRVAQDLDLARAAVAGVDLHAAVVRVECGARVLLVGERGTGWRAVGPDVGLDAREQRARRGARRDGGGRRGRRLRPRRAASRGRPGPRRRAGGWRRGSRWGRRGGARRAGRCRSPRGCAPTVPATGEAGTGARRGGRRARAGPPGDRRAAGSGRTARAATGARRGRDRR